MTEKIKKAVLESGLIERGDKILVGLSGGADSVTLTHVLCSLAAKLDITVFSAHVNHGIRKTGAPHDEKFARRFAESMGIECFVKHAMVKKTAAENGISEELAGRQVRYAFFDEISAKYGINKIATAHNKNDNAETILMNFMRGSSLAGLCGIPQRRGAIIRPLLDVSRSEIEEYCRENKLEYVTDSTNLEKIYTRNKIRLDLIPYIEKNFNPNFINTVTKNAALVSRDACYLDDTANRHYEGHSVSAATLAGLPRAISGRIVHRMLEETMRETSMSAIYIENILSLAESGKSGHSIDLPEDTEAVLEHGMLHLRKKMRHIGNFEYVLPIGEQVYIPEMNMKIRVAETKSGDGECFETETPCVICVRNRRPGDIFFPEGMNGRKKVQNYFTDAKIPLSLREKTGILTINEEIAWIIGKRRDRRFRFVKNGIKVEYCYCNNSDNMVK